VNELKADL